MFLCFYVKSSGRLSFNNRKTRLWNRARKEVKGSQTLSSRQSTKIGEGKWGCGKGQNWNEKGSEGGKDGGKNSWQKGSGKTVGTGQKKGGKGETRMCWTCSKTGHIAVLC